MLLAAAFGWSSPGAAAPHVTVLVPTTDGPFGEVLRAFSDGLHELAPDAEIQTVQVAREAPPEAASLASADVVVALGGGPTESCARAGVARPMVAALVPNYTAIAGLEQATAVVLERSAHEELTLLLRLLPQARRVGMLYDPAVSEDRVAEARAAAALLGLQLEARPVRAPSDLPHALANLANRVDVLWGQPDPVFSPQTARGLLLFSFRNRVPLVGPSASWVEAGALYAPDWDYVEIGKRTAEIAARMLDGDTADSLPPVGPGSVRYVLNRSTADRMRLDLTPAVIQGASRVF